jgi:hypothetical protein
MAKETEKVRTGFYIEKEVLDRCDELLEQANVKSRNEFVTEALKFYCGYLTSQKVENYLPAEPYPPSSSAPSVIPKTVWREWISKLPPRLSKLTHVVALYPCD